MTGSPTGRTRTPNPLAGFTFRRTPSPPGRQTQGRRVIRWIETHCVYTNGRWIGQPARLLPWEKAYLLQLFAVGDDARRVYRWSLLGVPKKNGKTELAAWLALYLAIGSGEPAPLVVIAAASDDQADLVFGAASRCAELSPTLRHITDRYEREMLVPSIPGAKIRRVTAARGTNDGLNVAFLILDELHQWTEPKSRDVWTVLTNGTGSREQPLVIQITTAGTDEDTVCGEQYQLGVRTVDDPAIDPRFFFMWFAAPDGADWRDPAVWQACNPSWGATLPDPEVFFADQLGKKRESEFRRYFLNQWVESEEIWDAAQVWDDLACPPSNPDDPLGDLDPAAPVFVGIDVGLKHDSSAVSVVQVQPVAGGRPVTVARTSIWENPYPRDHRLHSSWRLDIATLETYLREVAARFPVSAVDIDEEPQPGPGFFYDPHFFERSAQSLTGDGLAMVEFPQTDSRMVPASQLLYTLIVGRELVHEGDPNLRRHIRSVVPKETERGWRISRPRGTRKRIDGAVSLAVAAYNAHQKREQAEEASPGFHTLD